MIRLNLKRLRKGVRMYDAVISETVTITGHEGDAIEA